MLDKQDTFDIVQAEVFKRITTIQLAFDDLNAALTSNTKSSAGDKHETGRAMAQLEQEKLSQQLNASLNLRNALSQIDPSETHEAVQFGSLVETTNGTFFLSVGIGSIGNAGSDFFCISPVTPMGKALMGAKKGDTVQFNNKTIEILSLT